MVRVVWTGVIIPLFYGQGVRGACPPPTVFEVADRPSDTSKTGSGVWGVPSLAVFHVAETAHSAT